MSHWIRSAVCCAMIASVGCDSGSKPTPPAASELDSHSSAANLDHQPDPVPKSAPPAAKEPFSRTSAIESADQSLRDGNPKDAIKQLQRVLAADPEDAEVIFRLSSIYAQQNDLETAVEMLDLIPEDHPDAGLPALGQAADWYMALEQYDDAESRYQKVLKRAETFAHAHRQLAYLFNRQGRRHEAAPHLRALCKIGDIQQDELHALMVLGHAIFDDPNKPQTRKRPYFPIGPAAKARMLYTASRYAEAIETLDQIVQSGKAKPSIVAFYGLLAVETQDTDRYRWWLAQADESVRQFAEYWAAVGAQLLSERKFEQAVRALAEALDRDPTNVASMRRINQALTALQKVERAERWMDRYVIQRDATLASNAIGASATPSPDSFAEVANGLDQLHRPLEAATWRLFEAFQRNAPREEIEALNKQRSALAQSETAFPNQLDRLCGIDLSEFPEPELSIDPASVATLPPRRVSEIDSFVIPRFTDVASTVGLDHTFRIATQPQPFRFALYQSLGGGIAVLDYDLDGHPDLYLAQGGCDPPGLKGDDSNSLFRNVGGSFVDVTNTADVLEFRYSIGLTAGDWNQDGLDDLVVANIGNTILLINNGDGTFRRQEIEQDDQQEVLTSSVAMADVTGDSLPDLVALRYVEDKAMVDRPQMGDDGNVLTVSPASFQPGVDRIIANDGRGGMTNNRISDSPLAASTGLGVAIADWDGNPGNEIFVGNDIRPNHLWVHQSDDDQWIDTAVISGCAHGHGGMATASMGIAIADFDGNGARDIHITNFYLEPVSLFMNQGGTFEDRCVQFKLHRDSSTVLGFGCQAVDYNNDGRPDLAITNGNIELAPDEPLKQSPQFFVNLGNEFKLSDVDDSTGYWQGEYLGRGMARLDFDGDGKQDFLITHLDSPTALMANQTESQNHWLTVELVGVTSERDAIGTRVQVFSGDKVWANWIIGGDGYLCRNEPTVSFGLGKADQLDKIVVTWPNGQQQTFSDVSVDQRVLCIEGDSSLYTQGTP